MGWVYAITLIEILIRATVIGIGETQQVDRGEEDVRCRNTWKEVRVEREVSRFSLGSLLRKTTTYLKQRVAGQDTTINGQYPNTSVGYGLSSAKVRAQRI